MRDLIAGEEVGSMAEKLVADGRIQAQVCPTDRRDLKGISSGDQGLDVSTYWIL